MDRYLTKSSRSKSSVYPSILAVMRMTILVAHHSTFFSLPDHLTKLTSKEFTGCEAGKIFACGRTKTTNIIYCIGAYMKQGLINRMKVETFNIMLDISNHTRLHKMFPVTVGLFDINFNRTMTKVVDLNMLVGTNKSTAQFEFNSTNTFELS